MASKHAHNYRRGRSGSVETCQCGGFRFTEEYLKTHPAIVEQPVWTAQRVRDELPNVQVLLPSGLVCEGHVHGRLLPFATVTFAELGEKEWAWQTIADCLNRGVPLRA